MYWMFDNKEVAARHLPVAHGAKAPGREVRNPGVDRSRGELALRPSETRLRATVVADRKRDEADPYADVPCTD